MSALLAVRDLRIGFPNGRSTRSEVVHGIDLEVARGRVLALVGESGSGKSVTAQAVLRLLQPGTLVTGKVLLDGTDLLTVSAEQMRAVRGDRVGTVFQEPMAAWNPVHRIGAQIQEALTAHRDGAGGATPDRVRELLSAAGLGEPDRVAASYPHELSGGQLQRAMVAMATSREPDLLIADEPTTALDVTVQAGVLELLRSLARGRGTGVLLITHDMGVVADLADDVVVLRAGRVVERGSVEEVLGRPRHAYTRTLLAAVPRLDAAPDPRRDGGAAHETVARLAGVEVRYTGSRGLPWRAPSTLHAVRGVDLDLVEGRTTGLVGESGSGKSTVGRCLTGLVAPSAGRVLVAGLDLADARGRRLREIRREVGIVFQDPGSSLNPKRSVGRAIAEPLRLDGWRRSRMLARVEELLAAVDLDPVMAARFPHQLSGGQRQRVAIARALALHPRLLVADEPTSALDVSVQARVLSLLRRLQDDLGFACLFISHDLAVVGAVADDVAVMRDGRIVEHGPARAVLTAPSDPYTARLLAAAPVADPVEQRRRRDAVRHLV